MTEMEIKIHLVKHIAKNFKDFSLGSEVPFQFGERRADLALLESGLLTAFEIKSARDSSSKLNYQIASYKTIFDFCFIVCEPSNIKEIRKIIPKSIGILLIEKNMVKQIRKSKQFKKHSKTMLASTISLAKLKKISGTREIDSKQNLCDYIAKKNTLDYVRTLSRNDFEEKYSVVSRLLRQETTYSINPDDIHTITKRPPSDLRRRGGA